MNAPETADKEYHFPCDTCGADMRFDPSGGQMVCAHCGNTAELENGPWARAGIRELDFKTALGGDLPALDMEETRVAKCPNCAAEVEFDPAVHARECPFCATPVVTVTGTHRHIKPRAVLPFSFDETLPPLPSRPPPPPPLQLPDVSPPLRSST